MNLIEKLKRFLGLNAGIDLKALIAGGARIIDVRSAAEYANGHVKGSTNIPLGILTNKAGRFKKDEPIITCCASGVRSRSGKAILQSNGFTHVYNGGSWYGLNKYVK